MERRGIGDGEASSFDGHVGTYLVSAVGTLAACTLPMSWLQLGSAFPGPLIGGYKMFCKFTGPCGMQALRLNCLSASQVHKSHNAKQLTRICGKCSRQPGNVAVDRKYVCT